MMAECNGEKDIIGARRDVRRLTDRIPQSLDRVKHPPSTER